MTVIEVSTAEWQRQKLGPSLRREAKWVQVDLYATRMQLRALSDAAMSAGEALRNLQVRIRPITGALLQALAEVTNGAAAHEGDA